MLDHKLSLLNDNILLLPIFDIPEYLHQYKMKKRQ